MKTPGQPKDDELLKRTRAGDHEAFQELYRRYLDTVFRFAYRMLGSQAQAGDVAHDCFLALIRHPQRFDARRGSLPTYLYVAVRNLVWKRLRRRHAELPVGEEAERLSAEGAAEPLPRLLAQELADRVRRAIGRLPAHQREVVVLFEYEELSLADIAAIVGTDIGAVKSRLHRARARLRREMAPYWDRSAETNRERTSHG